MKKLFLLLGFLYSLCTGLAQQELQVSPDNPAFQQFLQSYTDDGTTQAAPSPVQLGFKQYFALKRTKSPTSFPMVYDMRVAGPNGTSLLTPVKHQLSCGACWTFATLGSVESVWKVQGLGDFDLSENNAKNCHGFVPNPCSWGHHFISTAYFVRGGGPMAEADDPYDPLDPNCTGGLTPLAYIPEAWYLPDDPDAFKNIIMNYGAVYNTYRSESADYSWIYGHLTYCYQGNQSTTHAMAIVGWNDTLTTVCGQGAWICKNEYGVSFGEQGYFYISYQDSLVLKYNAIWPVREDYNPDQIIYQYDSLGGWPYVGYSDSVAFGLVKYDVVGDQFFTRVGTYTKSYATHLEVKIYNHFDGTSLSGLLAIIPDTVIEYPGFHTLNLSSPLRKNSGESFYIQIRYNSPGELYPIAVEGYSSTYSIPVIETGKCWSRMRNSPWTAWGTGTNVEFDICIKAYAFPVMQLKIRAFMEGPFHNNTMDTLLSGVMPDTQPYSIPPWNYSGSEAVITPLPAGIVDWVLLELRETNGDVLTATSTKVVARKACFIREDGFLMDVHGDSLIDFNVNCQDSLFVILYHRNHLPLMSATALIRINGVYPFDFTTSPSRTLGGMNALKELGNNVFGMIAGNALPDSTINVADKTAFWNSQSGIHGYFPADFDFDKEVNNSDKNDLCIPNLGRVVHLPR